MDGARALGALATALALMGCASLGGAEAPATAGRRYALLRMNLDC